jgi:hypothetical protein
MDGSAISLPSQAQENHASGMKAPALRQHKVRVPFIKSLFGRLFLWPVTLFFVVIPFMVLTDAKKREDLQSRSPGEWCAIFVGGPILAGLLISGVFNTLDSIRYWLHTRRRRRDVNIAQRLATSDKTRASGSHEHTNTDTIRPKDGDR